MNIIFKRGHVDSLIVEEWGKAVWIEWMDIGVPWDKSQTYTIIIIA